MNEKKDDWENGLDVALHANYLAYLRNERTDQWINVFGKGKGLISTI